MKQVLRDLDLPGHGRAAAGRGAGRDRPLEERPDRTRARRDDRRPAATSSRPYARPTPRYAGAPHARPARSTSTTCSTRRVRLFEQAPARPRPLPGALALPARRRVPGHQPGAVPVGPPARRARTATSPSSATTTRASTPGAARTCATSSTSSATTPTPRSSSWSRTTARRSSSSTPRTRSCRATRAARTRSSGPRTRAACSSSASRPTARTRRRSGSRARSRRSSPAAAPAGRSSPAAPTRATSDVYRLQDIAVMYRTNAQSRAIEEAFLRYGLRYQLVGGTRFYQRREVKDALAYLRVAAQRPRRGRLRADHQRAGARHRRADHRGAARARRGARRRCLGGASGRPPRARASSRPAPATAHRRLRGARHPAARAGSGMLALPELLDAGARGVGLPGDAPGRLAGGRGPLGQPARAARGRRPLRATSSPRMRSTGCSRRRRWWPTRTPTPATRTRSRSSRSTPPRASSSTSCSSRASRRASSRTRGRSTTRARWRRSGGSRTSA